MNYLKVLQRVVSCTGRQVVRRSIIHESYQGEYRRTSVSLLSKDIGDRIVFDSYSNWGFKLSNQLRIIGPCAVFPRTVLQWNVKNAQDIDEGALMAFMLLEPKIEILVLGLGNEGERLRPEIIQFVKKHNIALEAMPTSEALTTFNFLNADSRYVAGGFIPPAQIAREFAERDALAYEQMMKQLIANETDPDKQDIVLPGTPLEMAKLAMEKVREKETTVTKDGKPVPPDRYTLG